MSKTVRTARYQQIAADVAGKIVSGGYKEGERILRAPLYRFTTVCRPKLRAVPSLCWQI